MTRNSAQYSELFWMILITKIFSKNSKLRVRYFFWYALQHNTRKKRKKSEGHRQVDLGWNASHILVRTNDNVTVKK